MKTTKLASILALFAVALAVTFTACKKDKDDPSDDLRAANDNAKVEADMDMTFNDLNEAFSKSSLAQRVASPDDIQAGWTPPCGCSVDTSLLVSQKQITFNFDGTTVCFNSKIRGGQIVGKLLVGDHWSDEDAVLKFTFNNYTVTHVATSLTFTYNGTKTFTNVNGGLIRLLGPGQPTVTHKVRGNLSVTFDDGTERTWWVARYNTYDYNGGNHRATIAGDSLIANADSVLALIPYSVGGVTRFGTDFKYRAPLPIVATAGCGWDRPIDGQRILLYNNRTVTITLGVDAMGNPAGGSCAYGYKVEWVRYNGDLGTAVIAY